MAVLMVAAQSALAWQEYSGGDGGPSGAFGVEWPLGGSYDEGFSNTEDTLTVEKGHVAKSAHGH